MFGFGRIPDLPGLIKSNDLEGELFQKSPLNAANRSGSATTSR